MSGDWVFELRSGVSTAPELEAFLRGEPTFTNATFGLLDFPRPDEVVTQPYTFFGWALSPWGIRKVDLLFDNGQVRYPTKLGGDAELKRKFPWYPATPSPQFALLSRPPRKRAPRYRRAGRDHRRPWTEDAARRTLVHLGIDRSSQMEIRPPTAAEVVFVCTGIHCDLPTTTCDLRSAICDLQFCYDPAVQNRKGESMRKALFFALVAIVALPLAAQMAAPAAAPAPQVDIPR